MVKMLHPLPAGLGLLLAAIFVLPLVVAADEKPVMKRSLATFQSGVAGYDGTVDIELWALAPTTILDTNPNATSAANNDGGESQVLLRFERIVGNGPGQLPPGSAIHSATLIVSAFDQ